jgi:L-rhamnose mutarotase
MTNNTIIVTLYGKLIKTSQELDKEITQRLNKRGFLPDDLIAELANEHARRYNAFIAQTSTGVFKFYTSTEVSTATLHKTAVMQWSRTIGKLHDVVKSNRGGAHKTEAKPEWQKLGDSVLKLNKSDIDRLMKYIGRA